MDATKELKTPQIWKNNQLPPHEIARSVRLQDRISQRELVERRGRLRQAPVLRELARARGLVAEALKSIDRAEALIEELEL